MWERSYLRLNNSGINNNGRAVVSEKSRMALGVILGALAVMLMWGSLYPATKLAMKSLSIGKDNLGSVLMFAAMRFLVCGFVITVFSGIKGGLKDKKQIKTAIPSYALVGIFSVVLNYSFNNLGLVFTESSKTAILKQVATLLYVCFSFLFIKSEKFSMGKTIGAVLGFLGIIVINLDNGGISFSVGEAFVLMASVCTVISNILSKRVLSNSNSVVFTGISQLFGGIILFAVALMLGGSLPKFDTYSAVIFMYICLASSVSYCLWYGIIGKAELSRMFIIKFAEPLFACVFSSILLGEAVLQIKYVLSFLLICSGITLGNMVGGKKSAKSAKKQQNIPVAKTAFEQEGEAE